MLSNISLLNISRLLFFFTFVYLFSFYLFFPFYSLSRSKYKNVPCLQYVSNIIMFICLFINDAMNTVEYTSIYE